MRHEENIAWSIQYSGGSHHALPLTARSSAICKYLQLLRASILNSLMSEETMPPFATSVEQKKRVAQPINTATPQRRITHCATAGAQPRSGRPVLDRPAGQASNSLARACRTCALRPCVDATSAKKGLFSSSPSAHIDMTGHSDGNRRQRRSASAIAGDACCAAMCYAYSCDH